MNITGKGRGVITMFGIRSGEIVCRYTGDVIGPKKFAELYTDENGQETGLMHYGYVFSLLKFKKDLVFIVDGQNRCDIGPIVNHSCDSNTEFVEVKVRLCFLLKTESR